MEENIKSGKAIKSFQKVSRNILLLQNFQECVIWIAENLFSLWCPTPVWNRKAIGLIISISFTELR